MSGAAVLYEPAAQAGDFRVQFNHARLILQRRNSGGARKWLLAMEASATPELLAKARRWAAVPQQYPKSEFCPTHWGNQAAFARGATLWCSPERHGQITGIMKAQIDHLPLEMKSMRPTQGRTLAVMQVSGGSQSFNAVNTLRLLGRWMRMFTIPHQSSVAMAYKAFDEAAPYCHCPRDVSRPIAAVTPLEIATILPPVPDNSAEMANVDMTCLLTNASCDHHQKSKDT